MAKHNQNQRVVAVQAQSTYSGPIPPPEALEKYNNTLPGAADRIITMAEKEQQNRYEMAHKIVNRELRGQIIGAVLILILIAVALYLAIIGQTALAGIIFGGLIGTIGVIFVLHQKPSK